jgi:hypothetical protein
MVNGCGAAVQADAGRVGIVTEKSRIGNRQQAYARFALLRAGLRREEESILRLYGTAIVCGNYFLALC